MQLELNVWTWLVSALPILVILVGMIKLRIKAARAGFYGWLAACIGGFAVYGADVTTLLVASFKGVWAVLFIAYIIWGAFLLYNLVEEIGGFRTLGAFFGRLTRGHRLLQLFVIAWAFPSFLQGVIGFGAPAAITAPLLVGVGFAPLIATASALIGHGWSVAMGSLGANYWVLLSMTGLESPAVAGWAALLLTVACLLTGFCLAHMFGGWRAVRQGTPAVLLMALVMSAITLLMTYLDLPYITSVAAGFGGLLAGGLWLPRLRAYRSLPGTAGNDAGGAPGGATQAAQDDDGPRPALGLTLAPYAVLIGIVFAVMLTPLQDVLARIAICPAVPETATAFGWVNQGSSCYQPLPLLATPGSFILAAAIVGMLLYRSRGLWSREQTAKVLRTGSKQAWPAGSVLITMGMMALVMVDSGMIRILAEGMTLVAGPVYPFIAPFVGLLGAFITGSNASSNLLFSSLQYDAALLLGLPAGVIAAAQTTGGSVGSVISPLKLPMGTALTGISGQEGTVLALCLKYVVIIIGAVGVVTWLLALGVRP